MGPLLDDYGFLDGAMGSDSACLLSCYYQFFREVLFALELGGSFVLLSDERSPTFSTDGPMGERGAVYRAASGGTPSSINAAIGSD